MEITQKEVNEIHPVATEMLKVFVEVCNSLNLHYYIFYGSLIGAIRHKGFIPWDDDIDIVMPRTDYNVLLEKAQSILPKNYFLQSPYSEPNMIFSFSKLRKSDTTYIENRVQNINMNHGLWLDIFCLDYVPVSWWDRFKTKTLRKYLDYASYDCQQTEETRKAYSVIKKVIVKIYNVLFPRVSMAQQLNDANYASVAISDKWTINNSIYNEELPIEWFGEGVLVDFEGLKVNAPKEYDKCLRLMYGDYMQLPPEEKRIPRHEVVAFDLHKSYTHYLNK